MRDYSELRKKAEAATPGEWHIQCGDDSSFMCMTAIAANRKRTGNCGQFAGDEPLIAITYHQQYPVVDADPDGDDCGDANSEYIAAANPATILALLDELDSLRAKPAKPKRNDHPPAFDIAYEAMASAGVRWRSGSTKPAAFIQWKARINAGATDAEMIAGAEKYARYCNATGCEVKQAQTFFGRGEHYSADWTVRAPTAAPGKFDPVAHINQARTAEEWNEIIDITPR